MSAWLFKLLLNLFYWNEARFETKAEQIITAMTSAPMLAVMPEATWPDTVPTRAAGLTALAAYKAAALVATDGSKTAIKDRIQKRFTLMSILRKWIPIVELAAEAANDITILEMSGFDLRQSPVPTPAGAPPPPVIVVKHADVSRAVIVRVQPKLKGIDTYEGQFTTGDPTVDANFTGNVIPKTGTRIRFSDLELGKLHHFRVRGYGKGGPGDWSDPVGIIVT